MKSKKIIAAVMATAMAASMTMGVATTAFAADYDTPVQEVNVDEVKEASSTPIKIKWNYGNDNRNLKKSLYKLDMSEVSMADSGVKSAYMKKSGTDYILTLNTQKITKSIGLGTFSANITGINAYGAEKEFTVSGSDNVWTITIPQDSYVLYPNNMPNGYDYAIKLQFDTDLPDIVKNTIPAMGTPSAFFIFEIK